MKTNIACIVCVAVIETQPRGSTKLLHFHETLWRSSNNMRMMEIKAGAQESVLHSYGGRIRNSKRLHVPLTPFSCSTLLFCHTSEAQVESCFLWLVHDFFLTCYKHILQFVYHSSYAIAKCQCYFIFIGPSKVVMPS